jgi:Zn-dependent M16 (insulinase) family peptidase
VAQGQSSQTADDLALGHWTVAGRALSLDYLWNEVRVKGGAYGTGFRHTTTRLTQFWSYRDPGVDATLARFERAGEWLAAWDGGEEELEGYVVSSVATMDTPVKPRQLARRQDTDYLMGRDSAWRAERRRDIITTTADDLHACAPTLASLADNASIVVFGSEDKIAASNIDFEVTRLIDG